MGTQLPFPKRRQSPGAEPSICGPCLLWSNGWMDQVGTWHGGRPWSSPHCARWGHSSPTQKGAEPPLPNFWPIFIVAKRWMHQNATWYGGRPGTQPPTPKGAEPHPIFGPCLVWPNGCMDQDATWYGGRPRPTRDCV